MEIFGVNFNLATDLNIDDKNKDKNYKPNNDPENFDLKFSVLLENCEFNPTQK